MALSLTHVIANGNSADGPQLDTNYTDIKTFVDTLETDLAAANVAVAAYNPKVTLVMSTDKAVAAAVDSKITWDTETLDGLSSWWTSGTTLTVPAGEGGVYLFSMEEQSSTTSYYGGAHGGLRLKETYADSYTVTNYPDGETGGDVGSGETFWRSWGTVLTLTAGQTFYVDYIAHPLSATTVQNVQATFIKVF